MTDRSSWRALGVFVAALAAVSVGTAAGLAVVPVAGSYVGTALGAFLLGLALPDRPTLAAGIAGVLARLGVLTAGGAIGDGLLAGLAGLTAIQPVTLVVSLGLAFVVGALGAHFGDDLRDGLTEPLEEPSPVGTTGTTSEPPRQSTEATADEQTPVSDRADEQTPVSDRADEQTTASGGADEPSGGRDATTDAGDDWELEREE